MGDFPNPVWPPLNVITPFHGDSVGFSVRGLAGTALFSTSSAAPVANLISYYPFRMYQTATAVKMTVLIGSANTGNLDVGIYDSQENRLVSSGTTALGTTNTLQTIDITDTALNPGVYYMAIQFSSASGSRFTTSFNDETWMCNCPAYEEAAGGFGLPATATFAPGAQSTVHITAMGVHFDTLI